MSAGATVPGFAGLCARKRRLGSSSVRSALRQQTSGNQLGLTKPWRQRFYLQRFVSPTVTPNQCHFQHGAPIVSLKK